MTGPGRLFGILWTAFDGFNRNDGSPMAGYIAFSGLLSLFPFLIFCATLTGILLGPDESDRIIDALFEIAPQHVALTLEPVVSEVLNKQSGEVLTLSALFAIWVASNAVEAFRLAFDRAYAVDDPRNFFQNRALAISLVFLGAMVAVLLGVSIIFSPILLHLLRSVALVPIPPAAGYITYGFGIVVFLSFILVMHRTLPGRSMRGTHLWPGALTTTVLWVILASGFTIYLSFTPTYTVTYGTLAGVIITLMFFYLTGATIIYGAEVNAALDRTVREENARILARSEMGATWRWD
ncbi:MAG TPA: YihY/virulence factor BrkB family protein [Amaricoccus sp.]|uniref:YihY/virulence factor BrkB family protein n=1 Tax=Amaricoccus sp. TaxID=1872485 RepID=UPI002C19AB74|nr:YihY/virulence factor BrkB family protein [Amaricoccus sp.]HMQ92602.1 YihY/virulence factor BrkB family protein [Amaricoccus sp.]HMR52519.1 YihY/virulence factor BrkB family protein [Amaricoccus sp.]HMR59856.1 YihY/virulence factor BrkB family protein [Amaricoccus sp.]HMT99440.1 YihY/virulence factor BrkB family protein [Amaricoccus sp.]